MLIKISGVFFKCVMAIVLLVNISTFIFVSDSFAQNVGNKDKGVFEKTADSAIAALQEYSKGIDNSIEDIKQRIIESPDDAALYYNLGTFYLIKYRNNNSSDQNLKLLSEKSWEHAVSLDPEYAEKVEKVRVIYSEDSKKQSISSLIKELETEKIFWSKIRLARTLLEQAENEKDLEKCDQAIDSLDKALKIEKDNDVFLFLGDAYRLKFLLSGKKDTQLLKEAIRNWKQVKGLPSEIVQSKIAGAELLMERKDDLAERNRKMRYKFYALKNKDDKGGINNLIEEITEIIKSSSHEINLYILLKDIYVFLNKTENVIEICSQGLVNNPDNIDLLMGRGGAYLKTQQYDIARIDFENVLKINPDYHWAQERLDMINVNKQRDEEVIKELIDNLEWQSQFNSELE